MPSDSNTPRWSSTKGAGLVLKQYILKKGIHKLSTKDKPKAQDLWKNSTLYQQYPLANFRSNYNRLHKNLRDELIAEQTMDELNGMNG